MTPSWPQLAGWLATVEVQTLRCSWREREEGPERRGTALFDRATDLWFVKDEHGAPTTGGRMTVLMPEPFERGDDFHRPATPVQRALHDNRLCWQVSLHPPARKRGLLTLLVDDETGLCLRMSNDFYDSFWEVTDLEVDVPLSPADLEPAMRERAEREHERELYQLISMRPPPTPQWFPWRRGYGDQPGCWVLTANAGDGFVSRAPVGQEPPYADMFENKAVVRLDHGDWSWAVGSRPPLDEATARQVVEQVVEGRPYD